MSGAAADSKKTSPASLRLLDLGLRDFADVWDLQKHLVRKRRSGGSDALILVEHPPVVTLGAESKGPPPDCGLPVHRIERGGRATYHGPGQLVGYPIVKLAERGLGIDGYLRALELALIDGVRPWVEARRLRGFTGVWAGRRKIASIGVAVSRGVAYHGFALNVSTDLSMFARIHPCGLEPGTMAALEELSGGPVPMAEVKLRVIEALRERLL